MKCTRPRAGYQAWPWCLWSRTPPAPGAASRDLRRCRSRCPPRHFCFYGKTGNDFTELRADAEVVHRAGWMNHEDGQWRGYRFKQPSHSCSVLLRRRRPQRLGSRFSMSHSSHFRHNRPIFHRLAGISDQTPGSFVPLGDPCCNEAKTAGSAELGALAALKGRSAPTRGRTRICKFVCPIMLRVAALSVRKPTSRRTFFMCECAARHELRRATAMKKHNHSTDDTLIQYRGEY